MEIAASTEEITARSANPRIEVVGEISIESTPNASRCHDCRRRRRAQDSTLLCTWFPGHGWRRCHLCGRRDCRRSWLLQLQRRPNPRPQGHGMEGPRSLHVSPARHAAAGETPEGAETDHYCAGTGAGKVKPLNAPAQKKRNGLGRLAFPAEARGMESRPTHRRKAHPLMDIKTLAVGQRLARSMTPTFSPRVVSQGRHRHNRNHRA